jgi:hypothetical protein
MGRADIADFCDRVSIVLRAAGTGPVVCDVHALDVPDAMTVEALARMQLTAKRLGHRIHLRGACAELRGLIAFMGLHEALPLNDVLAAEPFGQSEQREEPGGVQEETDAGDPPVRDLQDLE